MQALNELQQLFIDIANAIKSKTGSTEMISPSQFAKEIKSISTSNSGAVYTTTQTAELSTEEDTTVRIVAGSVRCNVNVPKVTADIDAFIRPENIRKGVSILGVSGSYESEGKGYPLTSPSRPTENLIEYKDKVWKTADGSQYFVCKPSSVDAPLGETKTGDTLSLISIYGLTPKNEVVPKTTVLASLTASLKYWETESDGVYTPHISIMKGGVETIISDYPYNSTDITNVTTVNATLINECLKKVTTEGETVTTEHATCSKNGYGWFAVNSDFGDLLEPLEATPSSVEQTLTPTTPKVGFNSVTINPIDAEDITNLSSENVKSGVTILGINGKSEVVDTTAGDNETAATAGDISVGKVAYIDGNKLVGTLSGYEGGATSSYSVKVAVNATDSPLPFGMDKLVSIVTDTGYETSLVYIGRMPSFVSALSWVRIGYRTRTTVANVTGHVAVFDGVVNDYSGVPENVYTFTNNVLSSTKITISSPKTLVVTYTEN